MFSEHQTTRIFLADHAAQAVTHDDRDLIRRAWLGSRVGRYGSSEGRTAPERRSRPFGVATHSRTVSV